MCFIKSNTVVLKEIHAQSRLFTKFKVSAEKDRATDAAMKASPDLTRRPRCVPSGLKGTQRSFNPEGLLSMKDRERQRSRSFMP